MDRQAKKSAKTQAEKEVNAMVEEHPFGPIENTLIVGYYRRGGFRPDRVRICKTKVTFKLPTSALHPIYRCVQYKSSNGGNSENEILGFQVLLKCSIDSDKLWSVMREQMLGYQLTFRLEEEFSVDTQPQEKYRVLIEFLSREADTVVRSHKVYESKWKSLLEMEKIRRLLDQFPGRKSIQIRVTRDCVALWVDGELRQQLTRLKPLNHPERASIRSQSELLDTDCLALSFCNYSSGHTSRYFKALSEDVVQELHQLKLLSELPGTDQSFIQKAKHLKSMINAIEFCYIRPFQDLKTSETVSIEMLRETVDTTRIQLEGVLEGNNHLFSGLDTIVVTLLLSVEALMVEFDAVLDKTIRPQIEALDPETLEHERHLYFISTPAFDEVFRILLEHSDIFDIAENLRKSKDLEQSTTLLLSKGGYRMYLGEWELFVVHNEGKTDQTTKKIDAPEQVSSWWQLKTKEFKRYRDDEFVLFWHSSHLQIVVLDYAALIATLVQSKHGEIPETSAWVIPPKLPSNEESPLSKLARRPFMFAGCLFLAFTIKFKLVVYFWSAKKQPLMTEWAIQTFEMAFACETDKLLITVIRSNSRHTVYVVVPQQDRSLNEGCYRIFAVGADLGVIRSWNGRYQSVHLDQKAGEGVFTGHYE